MAAHAALSPDQILRGLAELWVTLGKQGQPETGMGVLRACSLNLIVVADESDDFQALGETVAALMPEHPARAMTIRLRAAADAEVQGRVFSQCWMPFGQRRQICCEQIEILASQETLEDALALAAAVAAPDLPVVAWCRSARLVERPDFRKLLQPASRVVVDSAQSVDAKSALVRLAQLSANGVPLGDLAWTRLTRWRAMLAQSFENRDLRTRLAGTVQIGVAYGGTPAPVTARYMGAWLADSLQTAGVPAVLSLVPEGSAPEGQLVRVQLTSDRMQTQLSYRDSRLTVDGDGIRHCASLPMATDYSLMREELAIAGRDLIFERTLRAAAAL
jgi:glucose-6-phosphate dehydrogenase assembly protein OpcA